MAQSIHPSMTSMLSTYPPLSSHHSLDFCMCHWPQSFSLSPLPSPPLQVTSFSRLVLQDVYPSSIFPSCLQVLASSRFFKTSHFLLDWTSVWYWFLLFFGCCRGVRFLSLGGSFLFCELCGLLLSAFLLGYHRVGVL